MPGNSNLSNYHLRIISVGIPVHIPCLHELQRWIQIIMGGQGVEGEQSEPLGPRGSHMENLLMKVQF